jgi:hypothetical protein
MRWLRPDPVPDELIRKSIDAGCVEKSEDWRHHASRAGFGQSLSGLCKGRIYAQKEPKALVRIVRQAPLAATAHQLQRLRCNACGAEERAMGW